MDIPTRVGLGGTALFTLAGVSAPVVSWWVSAPSMALCAGVALWGFWPAMVGLIHRFPLLGARFFKGHALDRIPITELLKMAAERGWDFTGNGGLHLLDLHDAVKQGASDGQLTVWGRLKRWNTEDLLRNEVLEKIPPEHWRTFYVHLWPAITHNDNFHTKSWIPSNTPENYLDLHVNRSEAGTWLDRDAVAFRGKRKLEHRGLP